jgi:hypothetical protein
VVALRAASTGRKSWSTWAVRPYEIRDAYFVSMRSSSGAVDPVSRAVSERTVVVFRR